MPLIAYLIAIVVAIGGLGIELELLINSPPPHSAQHAAVAHASASSHAAKARTASVRQPQPADTTVALSPIYPANPGTAIPPTEPSDAAVSATQVQASAPTATETRAPEGDATNVHAADVRGADIHATDARTASRAASQAKDEPLEATAQSASNQCDVRACASAYSSFRASDCTYQPYGGARRLCSKGTRVSEAAPGNEPVSASEETTAPKETVAAEATAAPEVSVAPETPRSLDARAEARCNVARCSAMYRSFRASDCSYQPLTGGPRALCER